MARILSPEHAEKLAAKHRRGGPHRRGTKAAHKPGPPRRQPPLCPVCGRDNGNFGKLHRLTGRVCVGGYKRLAFSDTELLADERVRLTAQLRRALALLEAGG